MPITAAVHDPTTNPGAAAAVDVLAGALLVRVPVPEEVGAGSDLVAAVLVVLGAVVLSEEGVHGWKVI